MPLHHEIKGKWVSCGGSQSHSLEATSPRTKKAPPICLHTLLCEHLLDLSLLLPVRSGTAEAGEYPPALLLLVLLLMYGLLLHLPIVLLLLLSRVQCHHIVRIVHGRCHSHGMVLLLGSHVRRRLSQNLITHFLEGASEEE